MCWRWEDFRCAPLPLSSPCERPTANGSLLEALRFGLVHLLARRGETPSRGERDY